ncbi:6406_t:CDS:1, partial [Rhizophagus irregularis]
MPDPSFSLEPVRNVVAAKSLLEGSHDYQCDLGYLIFQYRPVQRNIL